MDPDAATQDAATPRTAEHAGDAVQLASGARVARYVVRRCIDRGGMGIVYEADDNALGRRVALKLLLAHGDPANAQRLIREARLAAALSHPNVVAVYEVGTHESGPFVAMEHVAGETLRQWLAARPRSWREIVRVFREAGQGIVAAHAAGLVHRDIKPDNILVGEDRVRVADFGLAREGAASDVSGGGGAARASDTVTQAGAVMGTPRYMAPEQRAGGTVDARADQYSFCFALGEALAGAEPPRWLVRVIDRGTREDPAARYPSVQALLDELGRDRARRWRWAALGAGVIVVGIGATYAGMAASRPAPCGGSDKLVLAWNDAARAQVSAAFAKVGFGAQTFEHVRDELAGYAQQWARTHRNACEATRVRGVQSEAVLDRQMACLDQRQRAFVQLVQAFGRADAKLVEASPAAVGNLPRVADCADLAAIARAPETRSPAAIRDDLIAARFAFVAGRLDDGRVYANRALAAARAANDALVEAEALLVLGRFDTEDGSAPRALEHLLAADARVAPLGDVPLRFEIWRVLATVYMKLGRFDEARRVLDTAMMANAARPDRLAEADLLRVRGMYFGRIGKFEQARTDLERSLALQIEVLGPEAEVLRPNYNSLSIVYRRLGKPEQALAMARRSFELARRLGDDHPLVASARNAVANALTLLGDYPAALRELETAIAALERHGRRELLATVLGDTGNTLANMNRWAEAAERFQRSLAIKEEFGADASSVLVARANVGLALLRIGDAAASERVLRQVVEQRTKLLGAAHTDVGNTRANLGNAIAQQGRHDEALAELRGALEVVRAAHGEQHPRLALVLEYLGALERDRKRFAAALAHDQEAMRVREKIQPADHPDRAFLASSLALDYLGLRKPSKALPLAEQAFAFFADRDPAEGAGVRFTLARVRWEARKDRPRALELARAARDAYAPTGRKRELAEIDAWLAARAK